jgi:hypothetical protein
MQEFESEECGMQLAARLTAVASAVVLAWSMACGAAPRTADPVEAAAPLSRAPEIDMVGRPVYAAEGRQVGRVDAVETNGDGRVTSIDVAVGDSLSLGPKVVRVSSDRITETGLEVRLAMSAQELGLLPSIDGEPE